MYIRVYREDIIEGLQKASGIIPAKSGAAYLRSIWIRAEGEKVEIIATDSSVEFRGTYTAEVLEPGLVGIQGRDFVEYIRDLYPGQISLKEDKESGNLIIKQGGHSERKMPVNDPLWFNAPLDFPDDKTRAPAMWSGDFIQEMLEKIVYCISDDEAMEAISCLNIKPVGNGKIDVCGMDGSRFVLLGVIHDDLHALLPPEGMLIQKKYLAELKKWIGGGEVELSLDDRRIFFRSGKHNEIFSLPVSSYNYPEYTAFMSKLKDNPDLSTLSLKRREISSSLKRMLGFNKSNTNRSAFYDFSDASSGKLSISAKDSESGEALEIIDVTYEGNIKNISFNTLSILEVISHFNSESLNLVMSGNEGPCGISGGDDPGYTAIIMPMKIVDEVYYKEEDVK
ncbi:MAG: DNA polymerase III subunit beta [Deltaproteobacteria bacterium]|jgi:DNA polymerase-3 subunit beta|nr:DNA polymerase III subunit beta [Deltaproteobacteria bacterium]